MRPSESASGHARLFVWIAAALGLIHAGFSLYWAFGGTWLLATVGQWAVDFSRDFPLWTSLGLGAVALAKVAASLIPLGVEYGRIGGRRFWRAISWVGGVGIIAYGAANVLAGALVLTGMIGGAPERLALVGHVFLWDPLFLLWGAALVVSLALSRRPRQAAAAGVSATSGDP